MQGSATFPVSVGSAPDDALPDATVRPRRHLLAATLGSALEYYDFATFTFFAVFIGRTYFPAVDPFASLILSLGTLAAGFLMRPLGSVLIGRIADRTGRKRAMLLTVVMMSVGTVGVAATPSYLAIGMAAPIIVILSRMIQGLAFGGEVGAAAAFVTEIAPPGRRNLYLGVLQGASGFGTVLAGAIGAGVAAMLPEQAFGQWGWRVPFLVGLLALPAGLYIRRHLPETLESAPPSSRGDDRRARLKPFRHHAMPLFLTTLAIGSMSISVYVSYYMTTYALTVLGLPASTSISIAMASGVASMIGCALAGFADRMGERWFVIVSRVLLILVCYPLFRALLDNPGLPLLMLTAGTIMLLQAISVNATMSLASGHFPASFRASALGISFALGASLFGGTTQLITAWLIHWTSNPMSTAYFLIGANIVGLIAILLLDRRISVVAAASLEPMAVAPQP